MKLLVVDDEVGVRDSLRLLLAGDGHEVDVAGDGVEALAAAARSAYDAIVCDVRMPGMDGLTFVRRHREQGGGALVIVMSAYGSEDAALEAMKAGAYDYIAKPFRPDEVVLVLRKAAERERLRSEVESLRAALGAGAADPAIVAVSPAMRAALDLVAKAAPHRTTVLLTGPSGTGKEVLARELHRQSPRASGPFVAVNCGAIPETLLESELFGHVRGAFTGAVSDHPGLFEQASGGTLLLDEVGDLPTALQVKLLRVLQEGEVRRVGDRSDRTVDVRIVAATGRDLEAEVAAGRFREDLFYRLNVIAIRLPPLADRPEDIPPLVRQLLARHGATLGRPAPEVEPAAMRALLEYAWPGNVRELSNVLERAVVLSPTGRITLDDLPAPVRSVRTADGDEALTLRARAARAEGEAIRAALARTNGNRREAAAVLGISVRSLFYKLKDLGIEP